MNLSILDLEFIILFSLGSTIEYKLTGLFEEEILSFPTFLIAPFFSNEITLFLAFVLEDLKIFEAR
jgi:hypothetical protein